MKGLRPFKSPFIYKRGKVLFDLSLAVTSLTGEGKKKPWKGFAFLLFSLKIYLLYMTRRSILYMEGKIIYKEGLTPLLHIIPSPL